MSRRAVAVVLVATVLVATAVLGFGAAPAVGDRGAGTVSGQVWFDRDLDGVRDAGEPGRAGARVTLTQGGHLVTSRTGQDGRYTFTGVEPGDYQVTNADIDGYYPTTPATSAVGVGRGVRRVDFGLRGARVVGTVWLDRNADGLWQRGDAVLPVSQEVLLEGVGARRVDDAGRFAFEDLPARDGYRLFAPGLESRGLDWTVRRDSAIDPATGASAPFALGLAQELSLDIGYRPTTADVEVRGVNVAPGRPPVVTAELVNHGTATADVTARITVPAGVRVTGGAGRTQSLAPGATARVSFTLVSVRELSDSVTVTVGADNDPDLGNNAKSARLVVAGAAPVTSPAPRAAAAHLPIASEASDGTATVITIVLVTVLVLAGAGLVAFLRVIVSRRR